MRKDIAKVIVERPRLGSRSATSDDPKGYKGRLLGRDGDFEDLPAKESMTRKYGSGKQLNENLAPLRRFLLKNAGRPWDKVYSEISEQIDLNSTVKRHIWQHVFDTVEKNTFIGPDGEVWCRGKYRGGDSPIADAYFSVLYVHPVDGLLKKIKKNKKHEGYEAVYAKRANAERGLDDVKTLDGVRYEKQKGIWYLVELKPIPRPVSQIIQFMEKDMSVPTSEGLIRDVCMGYQLFRLIDEKTGKENEVYRNRLLDRDGRKDVYWSYETLSRYYGKAGVYGAKRKQASSKELKAAGLKNDPQEAD